MTAPYITIPHAVFDARINGILRPEEFDVLVYCYGKAARPEYRVQGYSAELVCLFRGLDATKANRERYKRAAAYLLEQNIIRRDYYRIDPRRSYKQGRAYSVWVPTPARFQAIYSSAAENKSALWGDAGVESLCVLDVPLPQTNNVPLPAAVNDSKQDVCEYDEGHSVPVIMPPTERLLFVTTQSEKEPLNPLRGLPPSAPQGARSDAAGLFSNLSTGKALNAKQCQSIETASTLYANLVNDVYGFIPDVDHVGRLMRRYHPAELMIAQVRKFELDKPFLKTTMAHFFAHGAETVIDAARHKNISRTEPPNLRDGVRRGRGGPNLVFVDVFAELQKVTDVWYGAFPDQASTDRAIEERRHLAEDEAAARAASAKAASKKIADDKATGEELKRAANKWMGEVWAHASDLDLGVAWNRTNPPKPEWRDVFRERLTERVVEVIKRQDAVREHREIETLGASGALDYAIGVVKEHLTQRTEDLQSDSLKAVMDYAFESMADEILVRKAIAFMQMTRQLDQVSVNGQARLQWRKR